MVTRRFFTGSSRVLTFPHVHARGGAISSGHRTGTQTHRGLSFGDFLGETGIQRSELLSRYWNINNCKRKFRSENR
jgi:hypothetical protein